MPARVLGRETISGPVMGVHWRPTTRDVVETDVRCRRRANEVTYYVYRDREGGREGGRNSGAKCFVSYVCMVCYRYRDFMNGRVCLLLWIIMKTTTMRMQ